MNIKIGDICWINYYGNILIAKLKNICSDQEVKEKFRDGKYKIALVAPPPEEDVELLYCYVNKIYLTQESAIKEMIVKEILERQYSDKQKSKMDLMEYILNVIAQIQNIFLD
jgi:hypothetical protein